jgi:hypothetical protein
MVRDTFQSTVSVAGMQFKVPVARDAFEVLVCSWILVGQSGESLTLKPTGLGRSVLVTAVQAFCQKSIRSGCHGLDFSVY